MDDSGPSSSEAGHWEDELDACSDSDKSWGDETDADRESIASSLDSDDPVFSRPDVLELELELMLMYVRLSEWETTTWRNTKGSYSTENFYTNGPDVDSLGFNKSQRKYMS